jgi:hypothetical protein
VIAPCGFYVGVGSKHPGDQINATKRSRPSSWWRLETKVGAPRERRIGGASAVPALQGCAIDGMADCASALDDRPPHFRLAFSRRASTTRWTAAVPPSRCVRSRSDTDLYRAGVVKLEIISGASVRVACPPRTRDGDRRYAWRRAVKSSKARSAKAGAINETPKGARFCENPQETQ